MAGLIQKERAKNDLDPQLAQALKFAMSVLYKEGAAENVAKQLRAAKNKVDGLADVAYEITRIVDERTNAAVPRNLLGLLAMAILKEITDIGEAANMGITPADAAGAFKQMILRYLGENGANTAQLQEAMDKIDPSVFGQEPKGA